MSYSLRPSAWRLQWGWLEGHPVVKFRTKTPMNSQQLSLKSCNSWETVQPVLVWTIHRWRLDAKCLVVVMSDQLRAHITSLEVDSWMRVDRLCDVADSLSVDNVSIKQAQRAATSNWR